MAKALQHSGTSTTISLENHIFLPRVSRISVKILQFPPFSITEGKIISNDNKNPNYAATFAIFYRTKALWSTTYRKSTVLATSHKTLGSISALTFVPGVKPCHLILLLVNCTLYWSSTRLFDSLQKGRSGLDTANSLPSWPCRNHFWILSRILWNVQNSLSKGIADAVSGLPSLAEGGRRVHIPLFKPSFREKIATHRLLYMSNYEYVHINIYIYIYLEGVQAR